MISSFECFTQVISTIVSGLHGSRTLDQIHTLNPCRTRISHISLAVADHGHTRTTRDRRLCSCPYRTAHKAILRVRYRLCVHDQQPQCHMLSETVTRRIHTNTIPESRNVKVGKSIDNGT